jgi:uncharacterized protein
MTLSNDLIIELVRRIVETSHPLRIILFGSSARGDAGPRSDIDLLIEVPDGTHRRRTAQAIYRSLSGYPIPVDVVVATTSDINKYRDSAGLIYRVVLHEGKELYAA